MRYTLRQEDPMKKNTKSARITDAEVRARDAQVDALVAGAAALKGATAPKIAERFSTEQRVQIRRLMLAGDFEGCTKDEADEETIAWLAKAALFVLGLDPFADGAFCRLSEVVAGANSDAYGGVTECAWNEGGAAGAAWTNNQRDAEREAALKGRAA
jgi:hypothetical protein